MRKGKPAQEKSGAPVKEKERPWTTAEILLLGTKSDKEVAEKVGRTRVAVQQRRKNKGIPAMRTWERPWTREEDALLGTAKDRLVAKQLGRSRASVTQRRKHLRISAISAGGGAAWQKSEDKPLRQGAR